MIDPTFADLYYEVDRLAEVTKRKKIMRMAIDIQNQFERRIATLKEENERLHLALYEFGMFGKSKAKSEKIGYPI
jgi:hypothetical protein